MELIEIPKYNASAEWMIIIFIIVLFLIGWVKNTYPRRFNQLLRSFFNRQGLLQVMREELVFSHRGSIVLTIVYIIIGGVFLTLAGIIFNFKIIDQNDNYLIQFGYWSLVILLIYFSKWAINGLFFGLIQQPEYFQTQLFIISVFNKVIGLTLLPITILAAYLPLNISSFLIKIGVVLWAFILVYRLIKEVTISISFKIPSLYIIFYLCAFEISPFIIGIKLVSILNN
jgi:hypothetical protein